MKQAIIIIVLMVLGCSFAISLMALPEGAVAMLGKGSFFRATFSPDGKYLAILSSIGILLYDSKTYQEVGYLELDPSPDLIVFSPDSSLIADVYGSKIKLWDVKSGNLVKKLEGHKLYVNTVAFSPDGSLLASGDDKGTIILWDMKPYIRRK